MTSKLLIRIAAFLVFVHLIGHMMGHLSWDKPTDPGMIEVVSSMKSHRAEFMGAVKSMADYYSGYSFIMFVFFGMTILVLMILSNHTKSSPGLVKQLLYPTGLAYLFLATIEFLHFFPFAGVISLLAGLVALLAIFKLKPMNIN